ncbi:hypothetical protein V6N13_014418 [Hibiscus sabdariffa]|uniref:F-box associated beta-propeller type 3 domain-containing protein n=1 Tax=Hibiscus sabdariffa TaxID=183260 RepID=A0ABR2RVT1_9ROSI
MCLLECLGFGNGNGGGNGGGVKYLPEDLVIEILMRLPAEHLWRCRRVDFYSPPAGGDSGSSKLVMDRVFNGSFVKRWKRQMRGGLALPLASCKGLILFRSCGCSKEYYIGNPITGEILTLTDPVWGRYRLCGFFYHSTTQEYKMIHHHSSAAGHDGFRYVVSTLGTNELEPTKRRRRLRNLPYCVRNGSPPVILDHALYWMIAEAGLSATCENSIMMFIMDSEEFRTLPHPPNSCPTREWNERFTLHEMMNVLQMEGRLACLCLSEKVGDLWVFVFSDSDNYSGYWSRIYTLNFYSNSIIFPLDFPDHSLQFVSIIRNTELLLVWHWKGAFRYNLLTNAMEKIELKGIEESDYKLDLWLAGYTKSVVSLKKIYPCCDFYPKSKWNRFISKMIGCFTKPRNKG